MAPAHSSWMPVGAGQVFGTVAPGENGLPLGRSWHGNVQWRVDARRWDLRQQRLDSGRPFGFDRRPPGRSSRAQHRECNSFHRLVWWHRGAPGRPWSIGSSGHWSHFCWKTWARPTGSGVPLSRHGGHWRCWKGWWKDGARVGLPVLSMQFSDHRRGTTLPRSQWTQRRSQGCFAGCQVLPLRPCTTHSWIGPQGFPVVPSACHDGISALNGCGRPWRYVARLRGGPCGMRRRYVHLVPSTSSILVDMGALVGWRRSPQQTGWIAGSPGPPRMAATSRSVTGGVAES